MIFSRKLLLFSFFHILFAILVSKDAHFLSQVDNVFNSQMNKLQNNVYCFLLSSISNIHTDTNLCTYLCINAYICTIVCTYIYVYIYNTGNWQRLGTLIVLPGVNRTSIFTYLLLNGVPRSTISPHLGWKGTLYGHCVNYCWSLMMPFSELFFLFLYHGDDFYNIKIIPKCPLKQDMLI